MTTANNVLSTLKISGNLPSMPQVLLQLIDSCHEGEINLQEIAHIVDKDAAISAKLLQLVNSAFIGARRSFANVEQAVMYLGGDTVRNLAISISVQQVFRRVESNGLLSIDRFLASQLPQRPAGPEHRLCHRPPQSFRCLSGRTPARYRKTAPLDGLSR